MDENFSNSFGSLSWHGIITYLIGAGAGAALGRLKLEPELELEPNKKNLVRSRSKIHKLVDGAGAVPEPEEVGAAQPW